MDDIDYPYYGMEDGETYPSEKESTKNDTSSSESESENETLTLSALAVFDSRRLSEIDLDHYDFPDRLQSTSPTKVGSYNLPAIAFFNDSRRVSIHPLGVIEMPPGVSNSFWAGMDADGLFPKTRVSKIKAEEETARIEHEKKVLAKSVGKTSAGGAGGDKTTEAVEESHDPSEMPFLDHLEEFRWALLKSIFALVIAIIASWFFSNEFYSTITRLAENAELTLISTKLMEGIMLKLQMALVMGIVIALPFVFYFLWGFISPGLYRNEKKWILPFVFISSIFFFIGASIAYFLIIPFILPFIKAFLPPDIEQLITIGDFIAKMLKFTLLFGIIFELPLLAYILAKIGILKHTWMVRYRKYAIVSIFIMGAILTPPDPISQIMMAAPLIILYEISILVARFAGRKTIL